MAAWDRRTLAQTRALQEAAVRRQVIDAVAPFSPWWKERLAALGRTAEQVGSLAGLDALPALGERDLCPDGDPADAAGLVLQAGEQGWALHAPGPVLRRALVQRLLAPGSYRAVVEADTRPTSYVWGGLGLDLPLASTRGDLDVVARAGARLWQVLGLSAADVVVVGLPTRPSAALQALQLGALGAGSPAAFPGEDPLLIAEALRVLPATVLALAAQDAADVVTELAADGAPLSALQVLLLVGAPSEQEQAEVADALIEAGAARAVVLAVHAPSGHRLLWAQCRASAGWPVGLHTFPDLEVVQTVDPETGLAPTGPGRRELALTQLGLRGSVLLRWRTGDLCDGIEDAPCPACGRTTPRVVGLGREALVPTLSLRTGVHGVDVRAVCAALQGRPDVADWRVVLSRSSQVDRDLLLVHLTARGDAADAAVAVAQSVRLAAGLLPSQVVLAAPGQLPDGGARLTTRVLLRAHGGAPG